MKGIGALLGLFGAWVAPLVGAEWQDTYRRLEAGSFPLPRAQSAEYRFGWGAIPSADARIDFSRTKTNELELKLTVRSTGAARALWQMDATHHALASAETLLPIRLEQIEKYRRETEKTFAEFTAEEVVREQVTVPPPKTPTKRKRLEFPYLADMHTALLLVRSQRLAPGDRYSLVVYPGRTAYLAQVEVLERESLKTPARSGPAVKVKISLQHLTKKLELEPHKKFKNAAAWFSDDADRLLVRIETEVFVGSIWMEMQSVKFTEPPR